MAWKYLEQDPSTDAAAPAVPTAFDAAQRARLRTVDCYLAGVRAWRQAHPDQFPEYASKQAVAVIQAMRVNLRVPDA
jgi:hypothetical protein